MSEAQPPFFRDCLRHIPRQKFRLEVGGTNEFPETEFMVMIEETMSDFPHLSSEQFVTGSPAYVSTRRYDLENGEITMPNPYTIICLLEDHLSVGYVTEAIQEAFFDYIPAVKATLLKGSLPPSAEHDLAREIADCNRQFWKKLKKRGGAPA